LGFFPGCLEQVDFDLITFNNYATQRIKALINITVNIPLVILVDTVGQVSILQGRDCKFYEAVSLQLCKFTDN